MAEDQKTDPVMSPEDLAGDQPAGAPDMGQGAPAMTPEDLSQAQFLLQKIYTKDVSFEVPNGPAIFQEQGQADVKMSLSSVLIRWARTCTRCPSLSPSLQRSMRKRPTW